jgi:predicted GIY-YIG superfamily endonuclease
MSFLYRHIRHDKNEPFYIGIATHLKRAYEKGQRNSIWKLIVGKTEYTIEIIFDDLTKEQAYEKEKEFIRLYGKICNNTGTLANLTDGGETLSDYNKGRKASEETRQKLREAAKRKKPRSRECYEKTAAALRGRPKSEEHKRKLSEYFTGKSNGPWTEEHRQKNLNSWLNKHMPIAQYSLDGNLIKVWHNRIEASIELGIKKDQIRDCMRGNRKLAGGFVWVNLSHGHSQV